MADWYADEGNRGAAFLVFFLLVAAALAFLWFLGALRSVLVRAEGDPARWTARRLRRGRGERDAPARRGVPLRRPGGHGRRRTTFAFDPSTAETFANAGFVLLVCSTMAGALLVLATSIVAHRTGLLPALAGARRLRRRARHSCSTIFFLPLFVWLAWVLAVSVVLVVRTARVAGWRAASRLAGTLGVAGTAASPTRLLRA